MSYKAHGNTPIFGHFHLSFIPLTSVFKRTPSSRSLGLTRSPRSFPFYPPAILSTFFVKRLWGSQWGAEPGDSGLCNLLTWLVGLTLPQAIAGQVSQCNFFQPFMCVCVCVCVCVCLVWSRWPWAAKASVPGQRLRLSCGTESTEC